MIRSVLIIALGILFGQGVQILATPILTRLYAPDAYGAWSLIMSASALLSVISGLRYELAIVLPEKDEDAVSLVAIPIVVSCLFSLVALVILLCLRHPIALWLRVPELESYLWVIPILIMATGFFQAGTYWSIRMKQFSNLSSFRASQALGTAGYQIAWGALVNGTPRGLVLGTLVGQLLGTAHLWYKHWIEYGRLFRDNVSWIRMKAYAVSYRRFPIYLGPVALGAILRDRGLFLLLGVFSGDQAVGWLTLAFRMVMLPNSLVCGSLSPVYFQRLAVARRRADLEPFVYEILLLLTLAATPALVFLNFNSETLFRVVFGEKWSEAGVYARLLAPAALVLLLSAWMDRTLDVLGKQHVTLALETTYGAATLGLFAYGLFGLGSVEAAVALYSAATVLFTVVWFWVVFEFCGFSLKGFRRLVVVGLCEAVTCSLVWWMVRRWSEWRVAVALYATLTLILFAALWVRTRSITSRR